MTPNKKTLTVEIFDTTYALEQSAESGGPDIKQLAEYVDKKMSDVSERIASVSTTRVAVLTALEIAQELFENRAEVQKDADDAKKRLAKLLNSIDEAT